MFTSKFAQIRNSMHTFSRAPLAKGQKWIDQATSPAGHNIYFNKIRAAVLPEIESIEYRNNEILDKVSADNYVVKPAFKKILKFIQKAAIKEIDGTNCESYVVVDSDGNPITGFVDPADVPINQTKLSEGYDVVLFDRNDKPITRNYGWTFDFFNGILHFSPDMNPSRENWPFGDVRNLKIEGFVYIGKYVSTLIDEINAEISASYERIEAKVNSAFEIQPFIFSTDNMTAVGEPYLMQGQDVLYKDYFQVLSVVIPAYVIEIIMLDNDMTFLTEMRHLPNGFTQIFMNLPWHPQHHEPIVGYTYESGVPTYGQRIPMLGKYKFMATGFRNKDKTPIIVNDPIDYDSDTEAAATATAIPSGYDYIAPMPQTHNANTLTRPLPPASTAGFNYYSDDDVYVNIH